MKKMVMSMVIILISCCMALAEQTQPVTDDPDLSQLRHKVVKMKREMDKFIRDITETYPDQKDGMMLETGQDIRVDVSENDKEMLVKADLPGMDKDKIEVSLENHNRLKISGSRDIMKQETAPGMVRRERMQGRFERVLDLPSEGTSDGIKASYKNGVLDITIPKRQKTREEPVKVAVQ